MVIWSFGYCFGLVIDCINKFIYAFHPGGSDGKESACSAGSSGLIPGLGRSPGEGNVLPTSVFLPGESHGQRSLAGYSPWGCTESDMTELLTLSLLFSFMHSTVYTTESESLKS